MSGASIGQYGRIFPLLPASFRAQGPACLAWARFEYTLIWIVPALFVGLHLRKVAREVERQESMKPCDPGPGAS